ncbi:hypothetical protein WA1_14665 [Scytonema hofmannii PCC 7110]|uniref:Glycosyltransferase family 28 N-terminal domain-containing protein n=2 Tax=Scytonema hofmannii TaxID=34078 RepID=A0A139XF81_9CYAN|nr:hypothetical protein WA1_14665 [Scytonema hofmannii PCC 7110]
MRFLVKIFAMTPTLPILQTKSLQITILAVGSRGDLQPYCALAVGLRRAGHKVKIATRYVGWVEERNPTFTGIF